MQDTMLPADGFLQSAETFGARPALQAGGQTVSYAQLKAQAAALAATLRELSPATEPRLTAVFGFRSVTTFAGVLAALLRGHGYVPLNSTFPIERTKGMLDRSGCRELIVDRACSRQLPSLLEGAIHPLLVLLPEHDDVSDLRASHPTHRFVSGAELLGSETWSPCPAYLDDVAYLLFTSGSTGQPKGVMVANRNVAHYVNYVSRRYAITEQDRLSQNFDLTFDLSAHDMFVAWSNGACLCCPSQQELIKPGRFVVASNLSVWFSVPSTAVFMKRFGELKPGQYPSLRLSLFCGEALPAEVVKSWRVAAPNSVIENIYGPTELTIACTAYRWDDERSPAECELGVVPIGEPFQGMEALVADENLQEVAAGSEGELLMTGPQVALGYWQDEEKTARVFVAPPGRRTVYYRTGDRVRRPLPGRPMTYLGRMDNQIKIMGHRVELGEIEAAARRESEVDGVVAVGWPLNAGGADGIELFLEADSLDQAQLQARLAACLPAYMVPRRIHLLPRLPLNPNGKYDRKQLLAHLARAT